MNVDMRLFSLAQMTFSANLPVALWLLVAGLVLSGCMPAHSPLDEEKEAHFLAGKTRVNAMDFKGAIDSFEKALEANPQSGSAHFELGWLFDQKEADPAAAIYHYEHYLKLRPNAENADTVKTRIIACKQELARTVSLGPVTQSLQREFEQLAEENKRLRDDLEKWRAYATQLQAQTNLSALALSRSPLVATQQVQGGAKPSGPSPTRRQPTLSATSPRTHSVKAGETLTIIAKKYSVKLEALLAANPRVDARRLQVGQVLSIPPS